MRNRLRAAGDGKKDFNRCSAKACSCNRNERFRNKRDAEKKEDIYATDNGQTRRNRRK